VQARWRGSEGRREEATSVGCLRQRNATDDKHYGQS